MELFPLILNGCYKTFTILSIALLNKICYGKFTTTTILTIIMHNKVINFVCILMVQNIIIIIKK